MELMQRPSMINAPSSGALEKDPRWDLLGTEGCGGGNRVSWCSWMFAGYVNIYRKKKQVGGATRGTRGAHEGEGAPPASWTPCWLLDVHSKSSGSRLFQKSRSRWFHSTWTPFDIPFLRNTEIGKNSNLHQALGQQVSPKNNIKV